MIAFPRSAWRPLIALVLALAMRAPAAEAAGSTRPNIVVVVTDDQRWDMLGVAGHRTIVTPTMDRLAHEGVYFRQATAQAPQCTPSRATLLTGVPPHQHGLYTNSARAFGVPTAGDLPMLPRALKDAGYRTVLIGKWHVDYTPTNAGFSEVRSWMVDGMGPYHDAENLFSGADGVRRPAGGYTNAIFGDDAVAFLESDAATAKPFFLWVALTAPHEPFEPNPPDVAKVYAGKSERALWPPGLPADAAPSKLVAYTEAVTAADHELARILDALDRRKLAAGTLVVFVSDNGLMLGSRDVGTPDKMAYQGKGYPYEASIRVPVIVRGPMVARGVVSDRAVSTLDLPPTILAAAGLAPEPRWVGRDLGPTLAGKANAGPEEAFIEFADKAKKNVPEITYRAVRTPKHKLIVWREPRAAELYDLAADPNERHDLIADPKAAAIRKDLYARLSAWLRRTKDPALFWKSVTEFVP